MLTKLHSGGLVKLLNESKRIVRAIVSAQIPDREGDVLIAKGARLEEFRQNPVIFFNHASRELPIGKALTVETTDRDVQMEIEFAGREHLHEKAEAIFRLYRDGFLRSWSVGFVPLQTTPEKMFAHQVGRTISEWTLIEASAVGIPANPATATHLSKALRSRGLLTLPEGATDQDLAEALGQMPIQQYWDVTTQIIPAHRAVVKEIESMRRNLDGMSPEELSELFKASVQPLADRLDVLEGRRGTRAQSPVPFPFGNTASDRRAPGAIRSRGEAPYNLGAAILSLRERDTAKAALAWDLSHKLELAGFTKSHPNALLVPLGGDVLFRTPGHESTVDEIATITKQAFYLDVDAEELYVARKQMRGAMMMKAGMDPLDDTLGGSLIALPAQGELISLLRAQTVMSRAGSRQIPLPPQGSIQYPRGTGDPTLTWLPPGATIPDSAPTTGSLLLSARKAGGLVYVPNELVRYSGGVADQLVRDALTAKAALTEDLAFLEGSGGSGVPLGLLNMARSVNNTPTKDLVTLHNAKVTGAAGDTYDAADVATMLGLVEEAPDPVGATAWLMRPLMFVGIANKRADAVFTGDGQGMFLFQIPRSELGAPIGKQLAGVQVLTTTSMSKSRSKGAGTNLTWLACANFGQFVIGRVGVLELAISSDVAFASDQLAVRCLIHVDCGWGHPESAVICDQLVIPS